MRLTKKQTLAYDLALSGTRHFILYGGAIRGGKTYWLLLTLAALCSRYPRSRWAVVRQSLPTLKRTTLVSFNRILAQGLGKHLKSFNQSNSTATFTNGSELIFMSENFDDDKDLNRFRGLEINGAAVDELNEIQEATFNKLLERAGSWQGALGSPPILVLSTCNLAQNWVKERIYNPWKSGSLQTGWEYIPAKISDNPYITDAYLQSLKSNMPPLEYQRFVEGDWDLVTSENPFAYAYQPEMHESPEAVFLPDKPFLISFDFNLNPFGIIFAHHWKDTEGEHLHVFDELAVPNGIIQKAAEIINTRYGNYLYNALITGDALGQNRSLSLPDNANYYTQLKQVLKLRNNQVIVPANPGHSNSRADVNYVLHNFHDIKINPKSSPNLCRDLRYVQCDAFGEILKKNRNDLHQRADHLDCFRYLINTFLRKWIGESQRKIKE